MTELSPLDIELLIEAVVLEYAEVIKHPDPPRQTAYFNLIKKLMDGKK
jgi:hypothetical protein